MTNNITGNSNQNKELERKLYDNERKNYDNEKFNNFDEPSIPLFNNVKPILNNENSKKNSPPKSPQMSKKNDLVDEVPKYQINNLERKEPQSIKTIKSKEDAIRALNDILDNRLHGKK